MNKCNYCNNFVSENSSVCNVCGNPIKQKESLLWFFIALLIPVVGFFMFLVLRKVNKKRARMVGIGTLIPIGIILIHYFFF